jgi:hypothetical protein
MPCDSLRIGATALVVLLTGSLSVACAKEQKQQPPPTAWDRVMDLIGPAGEVSKDMALNAFAVTSGPVPGASRPEGLRGNIPSASPAIQMLSGH